MVLWCDKKKGFPLGGYVGVFGSTFPCGCDHCSRRVVASQLALHPSSLPHNPTAACRRGRLVGWGGKRGRGKERIVGIPVHVGVLLAKQFVEELHIFCARLVSPCKEKGKKM